jgi:zinc D-Ala-D-Ala carboxypeptidase
MQELNYFPEGFACPCCGLEDMDANFVKSLNYARNKAGIPFILNSAFRCPVHNFEVGGEKDSAHLFGYAVDLRVKDDRERWIIFVALFLAGFRRIGFGKDFIHVDNDPTKNPMRIWVY